MLKLNDGKIVIKHNGKYGSGLIFVLPNEKFIDKYENINWDKIESGQNINEKEILHQINVEIDGAVKNIIKGEYRKSKKGNNIFDITKDGFYLLKIDWGGSFVDSRGEIDPENAIEDFTYYKRASSNGGGTGLTYIVIPEKFHYSVNIDEI